MRTLLLPGPCIALGLLILAGCGGGGTPVTLPDTADGTANAVIQNLQAGNARVLWDAMPASFQKDAGDLVHSFGKKMDAEILSAGFETLDKVVDLMESKKDWILEGMKEMMGEGEDHKNLASHWGTIVALAKTIAASELRSTAKLQDLDLGAFLGTTGSTILKHLKAMSPMIPDDPFGEMSKMTFKAGEAKDGIVPVQLYQDGKKQSRPEKFQKVEGRWIFAEMAKEWPDMIAEGRKSIETLDLAKDKAATLEGIAKFQEILGKLSSAKDQDEFKKEIEGAMGGLMGLSAILPFGR